MSRTQQLLNINEVAQALGVTVACIRRWVYEGKVGVIKVGRLIRFSEDEVDRIINAGTRPARRECHGK